MVQPRSHRNRGSIEQLPSGALRVSVYAGTDPLTGWRHYLRESIPAGPGVDAQAQSPAQSQQGDAT